MPKYKIFKNSKEKWFHRGYNQAIDDILEKLDEYHGIDDIKEIIEVHKDTGFFELPNFCRSSPGVDRESEAMRTTEVHDRQKGGVNEKCK